MLKEKGFSYIETLIAACIMSMVASGCFKVILHAKQKTYDHQQQISSYLNMLSIVNSIKNKRDDTSLSETKANVIKQVNYFNVQQRGYAFGAVFDGETCVLSLVKSGKEVKNYAIIL